VTGGRRLDVLSLTSFVALGLPDGMLGTAWPSMRHTLGLPVGDLGLVLLSTTAGAVVITTVVGSLLVRAGVPLLLAAGFLAAASAAGGFALAPVFGVIIGVAVLFGVGAGLMDGGLNTAVGLSGRGRLLNLLHGAYGVGTAIGPLVVTAAVLTGSWRSAYVVLLAVDVVMAGLWLWERRAGPAQTRVGPAAQKDADVPAAPRSDAASPTPARRTRGPVAAGIVVFFVYTGLEVSAGQWETTFSHDHLHFSTSAAGLATFGYWAALTTVRIALGLLPRPLANQTVIRWSSVVAVVAAGVVWWQPTAAVTVIGFVVLGGALGGVFPALIALTPARLGEERAQKAIAWQVGAASAGGAAVSAVLGLLISATSLAILGPAITLLAVVLIGAELVLARLAPLGGTGGG
jgi:fucose permease